jgi:hypothetical protein
LGRVAASFEGTDFSWRTSREIVAAETTWPPKTSPHRLIGLLLAAFCSVGSRVV